MCLLGLLRDQGVSQVAMTPHFYADRRSVASFLERRETAFDALARLAEPGLPELRKGAEVLYYPGIVRLDGLDSLCLEGTRLLLLEPPFAPWTDYQIGELEELAGSFDLLIAHVDRYFPMQKQGTWEQLLERGARFQINADAFLHFPVRRRALRMLREGQLLCIGSDCHNLTSRPPKVREALEYIGRKCGEELSGRFFRFDFEAACGESI